MRTFEMFRGKDESNVSGTGKVLEGAIFSDGPCVVRWVTELNARSESRFDSFASFADIHITSHPTNDTKIVFSDGEVYGQAAEGGVLKPKKKRARKAPRVAVEAGPLPDGLLLDADKPKEVPQSESKKES